MEKTLDPLVLDLVAWCAASPRRYAEVIEAWRTSCPRLTVWEEACERGLVARRGGGEGAVLVEATAAGLAFLEANGRRPRVTDPL
jgi:hypothetical protein